MGVEDQSAPHMWVMLSYTPVEVDPQPDGSMGIYTREEAEEAARDDAVLACWHCLTTLTLESYTTPCPAAKQGS